MRRARALHLVLAARLALAASCLGAGEPRVRPIDRLGSPDAFERERAEVEVLRAGADGLPALVAMVETASDRSLVFRAQGLFSDILDGLLAQLQNENLALTLDRKELKAFQERQESARIAGEVSGKLDAWKKEDPKILEKVDELLDLERLEAREALAAGGAGPALDDAARKELDRLRAARAEWKGERPDFDSVAEPLLRLARLRAVGVGTTPLSEVEAMRIEELTGRVAERAPAVEALEARVEALGLPAVNGLLARRVTGAQQADDRTDDLVARAVEKYRADLIPTGDAFAARRYSRSLVWAWLADRGGPDAASAEEALREHLAATLADREHPDSIIRERAADELFLLQRRGRDRLEAAIAEAGAGTAGDRFLLGLLRWRIRPRVYARTGLDFEDYPGLDFRGRRQKVFDYARVAGRDATPTLRAIITDADLEESFLVKLGAAKALAGFRDLSGFEFLVARHPEMTLKRPEVSRELLIIQGFEHIRDKNYALAVQELRKLLDEFPFDFAGNYHIAFAYLLLKDYAKAIHHFEICRRISGADQLTLYNLACAYALSGRKGEALEALEAAADAGFDDPVHIEGDTDLESLRDDPRYLRLLERLRSGGE